MTSNRDFVLALFCALFCYLAVSAQTVEKPQGKGADKQPVAQDDSPYYQLVERVKSGDMTVDFVQLRDSFAEWRCNDNVKTAAPDRDAMVTAFEEKNYAKAAALVEVVLDYEFV